MIRNPMFLKYKGFFTFFIYVYWAKNAAVAKI